MMKPAGTLYLIPTFLSEDNADVLTASGLKIVHQLKEFIVENEKTARRFLKSISSPFAQSEFQFQTLNEHTSKEEINSLLQPLIEGRNIGLMSEAGAPGVADPGSNLVQLAHSKGIRVHPLIGPSSVLLSLMASGLNGQSFLFHGYLPREASLRKQKIKELEKDTWKKNQTQIFIETPYRNQALLADILGQCTDETLLCIAVNLSSPTELIMTKKISAWKIKSPDLNKKPCIFLLGK
ncbi:MAG: SAM-dependent methyltransferase [Bacteroidia bacterium]